MQSQKRKQLIATLLEGYKTNYNITTLENAEDGIVAMAEFHVSESGYVLTRAAETWTADSNEYVYFISVPHLSAQEASDYISFAYDDTLKRIDIKNQKHHMCTRAVTVFLCDTMDAEAQSVIRKCNLRKSFMFSLKGWMEVHTAAAILSQGKTSVIANRAAKETASFIESVI